jgi:predicted alpha/beta-fold hydrolase
MTHRTENSTETLIRREGAATLLATVGTAGAVVATDPAYQAPGWLRNRHLQTIWPVMVGGGPVVRYRRERWTTPDQDFIDLDWAEPPLGAGPGSGPLVALFHGLEGSSASHYARGLMAHLLAIGWRGVVINWRGCSGEPNLLARAYHSGDSAEVDWVLRRLRPDFVAGVSLGANALLKWLGEQGSQASFVRAAAGVSAPQDLHAGAVALSRGFNRLYCHNFMLTLKRKSLLKLDRFPGLYDRRQVLAARTFFDFDEVVTAPLHGFESAMDYWTRSSCKQYLGGVEVPTLVLNARNDPFVPEAALALPSEVSRQVRLDYPAHGGHVGFVQGRLPGSGDWLPQRLTAFFRQFA